VYIYVGSQLSCYKLGIKYRDHDGTIWRLLGTSNTIDGKVSVALGHNSKKMMKRVTYEDLIDNYTKIKG